MPGANVHSTYLEGECIIESGTSVAVPFVIWIAALFISRKGSLNSQEIRNLLVNNVFDLRDRGRDKIYGFELVQVS